MPTNIPSSYTTDRSTYNSTSKRSYKSLQDKNNASNTAQRRGKASSRDTKDPYRLSAIVDAEIDGTVVELCAINSPTHPNALNDGEQDGQEGEIRWTQRVEEQFPTIVGESPSPGLDDSASQKSILRQHPYS
jgi:hypothetical protein